MTHHAGIAVSPETSSVCIVDGSGAVLRARGALLYPLAAGPHRLAAAAEAAAAHGGHPPRARQAAPRGRARLRPATRATQAAGGRTLPSGGAAACPRRLARGHGRPPEALRGGLRFAALVRLVLEQAALARGP